MKNIIRISMASVAIILAVSAGFAQTPEWVEYCRLEQMKKAVADNNANPANLAYMIDRDLMYRDLPQLYGTQYIGVYTDDNTMENLL